MKLESQPNFGETHKKCLKILAKSSIILGRDKAHTHPKMLAYGAGFRNNTFIFNPYKTLTALRMAWALIRQVRGEGGKILFVTDNPLWGNAVTPFFPKDPLVKVTREAPLAGFLTNWELLFGHAWRVRNTIGLNLYRSSKRKRFKKRFMPYLRFIERDLKDRREKGIPLHKEYRDSKLPDLIVFFQIRNLYPLLNETEKLNIPTIALVNSDEDPEKLTLAIPGNNRHLRPLYLVAKFFASALKVETKTLLPRG